MSNNEQVAPSVQSLFKRPARGCALCGEPTGHGAPPGSEVSISCDWCYRDFCFNCSGAWLRRIEGCCDEDLLFLCKECDGASQYGN